MEAKQYAPAPATRQAGAGGAFDDLVSTRRRVSKMTGPRGLKAKRAFGEATAAQIDAALMRGTPDVLAEMEEAGSKVAELHGESDPIAVIDRLTRMRASPTDVASWLIRAAIVLPPSHSADVARRLKETISPAGWAELRVAVVDLLGMPTGATPKESADALMKFLGGRGEPLLAVLFSAEERETLAAIGNTARLYGEGTDVRQYVRGVRPLVNKLSAAVRPPHGGAHVAARGAALQTSSTGSSPASAPYPVGTDQQISKIELGRTI